MKIPVIETERLRLRAHQLADFPDFLSMWNDEQILKYTIGPAVTEQRNWSRMLNYLGHWQLMHFGYWAVADKQTNKYIGELGFADFKREMEPPLNGTPELGWALAVHAHGRGLATEGLAAAVEWGDRHLKSKRTVCLIEPSNTASIRVAKKCGYQAALTTRKNDHSVILFER